MTRRCLETLLLALVVSARLAHAQTATGTITGVARDASGAVVAGVAVKVSNEANGFARILTTNRAGVYEVRLLPPATYRIEAELQGFKKAVRTGIALAVDQREAIDLVLEVGPISEEVMVTARPPLVDSQSAAIGTVMDNLKIVELPLNGRDFFQLSTLVPGAQPPAEGSQNATQGGAVSVNGAREQSNNFYLDGVDNNDLAINQIVVPPSVDSIDQYKVQSSTYSAEYGRSAGGQFNYVTKSGTNQWRGSTYEFFRNAALDSKNYFDDPFRDIPDFNRHQFGATFGGPVLRDKAFVFGSYEGLNNHQAFTRMATVPPTAWINGDFSSLLTGATDPATGLDRGQLFDPRTGRPIPGNVIPAALRDPAGSAILKFYPRPDSATAAGPSGATVAPLGTTDIAQFTARLDQNVGGGNRLMYRYSGWNEDRFNPFDPLADPTNVPGFGSTTSNRGQQLAIGWSRTVGARAVNDLRFGFNQLHAGIFQEHRGDDVSKQLGIGGLLTNPNDVGRPGVILGITDALIEPTNTPQDRRDSTFQLIESFSWLAGRHSVKAGGDIRRFMLDSYIDIAARGQFIFAGMSGNPVADLMLGVPVAALRQDPSTNTDAGFRTTALNGYVQDDWQASDRLTLNLGLRYDYNQPAYEIEDRMSIPDLDNRTGGGYTRVGTNGIPRAGYAPDRNNVAPRLGFAWRPTGASSTVVRGGYGIYYDAGILNANLGLRLNAPFYRLDVFPGPAGLRNAFDGASESIPIVESLAADYHDGVYQHWSAGVERELPRAIVVGAAYVASKGSSLPLRIDPNQGELGGPPVRNLNFGPGEAVVSSGSSEYRSLQTRVERRFSQGVSFLTSYTWSRSRDVGSALFGSHAHNGVPQNSADPEAERGPSDFDTPHRLAVSYIWDIPVGARHRLLGSAGWASTVLGGWEMAGIMAFQSARPFTVFYGPAANFSGTSNGANGGPGLDRPNQVGDPVVANPSPANWFDPSAFAPAKGAFGTVGRNTLRGDSFSSVDVAFSKRVAMSGRATLQLRLEIFNVFNTANFFLPVGDLTNASAGQVQRAGDARQTQLGIKLIF